MDPQTPADLRNPSEYRNADDSGESKDDSNFWEADYRPTDNPDDIPLTPKG